MRSSKQKHNVARLRVITGEKQAGFAALVNCSVATIQSLETNRLNLSEKLALRISLATGVDGAWLRKNEWDAPPLTRDGKAYTRAVYEAYRAANLESATETAHAVEYLFAAFGRISSLWFDLGEKQDFSLPLARWRLDQFLTKLEEDFGSESGRQSRKTWRSWTFKEQADRGAWVAEISLETLRDSRYPARVREVWQQVAQRHGETHDASAKRMKAEKPAADGKRRQAGATKTAPSPAPAQRAKAKRA